MQIVSTPRRFGRPRKADIRRDDTSGRSRGESAAEITAVARAQRVKAGADSDDALNALNGSTLGILYRRWQMCEGDPGSICEPQYAAAQSYIATLVRYCEIMGVPLPRPVTPSVAGATRADPDEQVVLAVRRRFADLRRTLLDAGREIGVGSRVNAAVYRICIEDPPIAGVSTEEIENLRYGLNALARMMR